MTVAPSYAASSGEYHWSCSVWPELVKPLDKVGGVLKVIGWLPGRCVITLLFDQVLKAVVVEAAV